MNSDTIAILLTVAVFLSALGLLLQAAILYGLYRSVDASRRKFEALTGQWEGRVEETRKQAVEAIAKGTETLSKASTVLDLTKAEMVKIGALLTDASAKAKVQMDHAEIVVEDTLDRFQEVSAALHKGVLRPVREVNGVMAGIEAGFAEFFRRRRATVAQATHDDEMFI
jgi:hypothetical protein